MGTRVAQIEMEPTRQSTLEMRAAAISTCTTSDASLFHCNKIMYNHEWPSFHEGLDPRSSANGIVCRILHQKALSSCILTLSIGRRKTILTCKPRLTQIHTPMASFSFPFDQIQHRGYYGHHQPILEHREFDGSAPSPDKTSAVERENKTSSALM